jgi:CheY-like chemotaxis protein
VRAVGTEGVALSGADAAQRHLPPGRYVRLRVRDNGHGMSDATAARIFEPFFTTKPAGQGTGLGLAVVHGIVGAHGGSIEVSSQVGQGTVFDIHLPLCGAAPAAKAHSHPVLEPCGTGQRVLYVDDDDVMRVMIKHVLERLGYEATVCDDGPAALLRVREDPRAFDIVVTDFDMPGQSGLQLAEHLLAIRPDLPIVISSGNVTRQMAREALRVGVRTLMHKQHTVEELGNVLTRVLS